MGESPHYLVRKGRLEEAREVYRKLRGTQYKGVELEVQEVQTLSKARKADSGVGVLNRWKERTFLQPLAIVMVLTFFISINSVDCPLTFYGPTIFSEFGFTIPSGLVACLIPTGQLLGYLFAPILMTIISKRTQYILSTGLMALSAGSLSLVYSVKDPELPPSGSLQTGVAVSCLCLTLGYGLGMGSVSYAMQGELLSPEDKSLGISLGQCVRMLGTAAVLKVYPMLVDSLGYSLLFLCHALGLVTATLFVFRFLPETRDKSLTEIQEMFTGGSKTV